MAFSYMKAKILRRRVYPTGPKELKTGVTAAYLTDSEG